MPEARAFRRAGRGKSAPPVRRGESGSRFDRRPLSYSTGSVWSTTTLGFARYACTPTNLSLLCRAPVENLHHPSLHAKKYDEGKDRSQARVNRDWRFYFVIEGDIYYIQDITAHPK